MSLASYLAAPPRDRFRILFGSRDFGKLRKREKPPENRRTAVRNRRRRNIRGARSSGGAGRRRSAGGGTSPGSDTICGDGHGRVAGVEQSEPPGDFLGAPLCCDPRRPSILANGITTRVRAARPDGLGRGASPGGSNGTRRGMRSLVAARRGDGRVSRAGESTQPVAATVLSLPGATSADRLSAGSRGCWRSCRSGRGRRGEGPRRRGPGRSLC